MKAYIIMLNDSPKRVVIDNEERAKEVLFEMRTDYEKWIDNPQGLMPTRYWYISEVGAE